MCSSALVGKAAGSQLYLHTVLGTQPGSLRAGHPGLLDMDHIPYSEQEWSRLGPQLVSMKVSNFKFFPHPGPRNRSHTGVYRGLAWPQEHHKLQNLKSIQMFILSLPRVGGAENLWEKVELCGRHPGTPGASRRQDPGATLAL
jgi:hypothetical protein